MFGQTQFLSSITTLKDVRNSPFLPQTKNANQLCFCCCPEYSELHSDFRSRCLRIDMGDQNKRTSFAGNTFVQIIVCRQGTSLTF